MISMRLNTSGLQENWVVFYPRLKEERRTEKEEGERNYSSTRSCCHGVV
jgi:hypothetical protein